MQSPTFTHIVFFKLKDGVTTEEKDHALRVLEQLGKNNPDILKWTVKVSLDSRKGIIIVENAEFISEEAFRNFQKTELHATAGMVMREIADWWIVDYIN